MCLYRGFNVKYAKVAFADVKLYIYIYIYIYIYTIYIDERCLNNNNNNSLYSYSKYTWYVLLPTGSGAHVGEGYFLHVNLGHIRRLTGLLTAGRHTFVGSEQYVTSFAVTYKHPVTNNWLNARDEFGDEVYRQ